MVTDSSKDSLKAYSPIVLTEPGMVTDLRKVYANAYSPMLSTPSEIVMDSKLSLQKAYLPIDLTVEGMVSGCKTKQLPNPQSPMLVKVVGNSTVKRLLNSRKASFPTVVMPSSITILVTRFL